MKKHQINNLRRRQLKCIKSRLPTIYEENLAPNQKHNFESIFFKPENKNNFYDKDMPIIKKYIDVPVIKLN